MIPFMKTLQMIFGSFGPPVIRAGAGFSGFFGMTVSANLHIILDRLEERG
jgi:hypothetical protein